MNWLEKFHENINHQKVGISEKDLRFFHVERLTRVAGHLDKNSNVCSECMKLQEPLIELSGNLKNYIHGGIRERKYFERIFEKAVSHLRKNHRLYPPFYFNYLYSFIGFLSGIAAGSVIYFIFTQFVGLQLILILGLSGLFAGQVKGRRKDNQVRKEGRKLL